MIKKLKKIISLCTVFVVFSGNVANAITYNYDNQNRLIQVIYDDGSKMDYEYDDEGNITNSTFTPSPNELQSIVLEKSQYTVDYSGSETIKVIAKYSKNTEVDVTKNAIFKVQDKTVATVKNSGVIVPKSLGETEVTVTYLGKKIVGKIIVKDLKAPTMPSNLKSTNVTEKAMAVQWDKSTDEFGIKEYQVYVNNKYYKSTSDTNISIANLNPNTEYTIAILAKDNNGNNSTKAQIKVKTLEELTLKLVTSKNGTKKGDSTWDGRCDLNGDGVVDEKDITLAKQKFTPSKPKNFKATVINKNSVKLEWEASTDDKGIKEYKIIDKSGNVIKTTTKTNETITTLKAGTEYSFSIVAVDLELLEASSEYITVKTTELTLDDVSNAYNSQEGDNDWDADCDLNGDGVVDIFDYIILQQRLTPSTPKNLKAIAIDKNSVKLEWEASTDDKGIKEYKILNESGQVIKTTTKTNIVIENLKPNTTYSFLVVAVDLDSLEAEAKVSFTTPKVTLDDVSKAYNSTKNDSNWDEDCDINKDGVIDITDMVLVAREM